LIWLCRALGLDATKDSERNPRLSAACEFSKFGITANIVAPGATQTGWITPELEQQDLPTIPACRLRTPEDLADAIVLQLYRQ
jgi:3-oxoacyl-[acyl-carrier protein] reductase